MLVVVLFLREKTNLPDAKTCLCVIIPVYNHPDKLQHLMTTFNQMSLPVIMVDDGSDTNCRDRLVQLEQKNAQMTLQTHASNQGKGAAIKTGLETAKKAGFTHALQIDADGQHSTADIPVFLAAAQARPEVLISGLPQYDESVPKSRLYGRYVTHVWVWIETLSLQITDSMCGFRVYPLEQMSALLRSRSVGRRMDFDTDIMVKMYWHGVSVFFYSHQGYLS